MNVFDYAVKSFQLQHPEAVDADTRDAMESMPVESECGFDCKAAIDSAVCFINSIRKAHGDNSEDEATFIFMTFDIVCVFICG